MKFYIGTMEGLIARFGIGYFFGIPLFYKKKWIGFVKPY